MSELAKSDDYRHWIVSIKSRVQASQIKAAVSVNRELMELYWFLGEQIIEKQVAAQWGDGFLKQMGKDLQAEFPEIRGFSIRNLQRMRRWVEFWSEDAQQGNKGIGKPKRLPRILTAEEFRRFFRAVDQGGDAQHALMMRLLFFTGVRVSELCSIKVENVDLENCKINVIEGKGKKDRVVLFDQTFAVALRTHIAGHPRNRHLFQSKRHSGYTTRRVQQIVKQYAQLAEVKATPHVFRHQALTLLTKSGMSDAEIQLLSGHAQRNTLQIYQHLAVDGELGEKYQKAIRNANL